MNKRRLVLGSILVLLIALAAWGTWAYFTAEAHVTNVITTGTIGISLNDRIGDGTPVKCGEDIVGWRLDGVMPGKMAEKTVSVTNDGTGEAWVRVFVKTEITKDGKALPLSFGEEAEQAVIIGYDTENWISDGAGCYYYRLPVSADETTVPLMNTVTLNRLLPNVYQSCCVCIDVCAQAVQVKNNDENGTLGELTETTYMNVLGWPAA